MAKSIKEVEFELNRLYKTYADQLLVSNDVAGILVDSADIKASGNQLEASLRVLLSSLLSGKAAVSHGHVIDTDFSISRQQDVIITEGNSTKSIMRTIDGTEFLMYESVYSIGEVKRTWSKKTLLSTMDSIADIKRRLKRKPVPPDVFSANPDYIKVKDPLTRYPNRNPLFSFAFSIDFDKDVRFDSFAQPLQDKSRWKELPNIVIILKQGVFVLVDEKVVDDGIHINLYPEFHDADDDCKWYFLPNADDTGKNLAFLVFAIQQHLDDSILEKPSLLAYGAGLLNIRTSDLISI